MKVINVPLKDLGKYEKKLSNLLKQERKQVFNNFGKEAIQLLRTWSAHIRDLGHYQEGWHAAAKTSSTRSFVIYNKAAHAYYVEYGRRPGRPPPFDKIYAWVSRHFTEPSPQLARAISQKIAKRGTTARPVLYDDANQAELARRWQEAISKFWARILELAGD